MNQRKFSRNLCIGFSIAFFIIALANAGFKDNLGLNEPAGMKNQGIKEDQGFTLQQPVIQTAHRNLAVRNLVIYFDLTQLDTSITDVTRRNFVKRAILATGAFFTKLLTYSSSAPIISSSTTCNGITIGAPYTTTGVDADLVVIVNAGSYGGTFATGDTCQSYGASNPPKYATLLISLDVPWADTYYHFNFQTQWLTRYFMKIFGFHNTKFSKWAGGNANKISGNKNRKGDTTVLLTSPNILTYGATYYNCVTLGGIELENETGYKKDFWDYNHIPNDMMSSKLVIPDAIFSIFDIGVLQDTNWFSSVDTTMAESNTFLKMVGCGIANESGNCDTSTEQFFSTSTTDTITYGGHGRGTVIGNSQDSRLNTANNCRIAVQPDLFDCTNDGNSLTPPPSDTGEYYGMQSRMFISNAVLKTQSTSQSDYRCFQTECTIAGNINIYVGSGTNQQIINCIAGVSQGQTINIGGTFFNGGITCPTVSAKGGLCNSFPSCPLNCSKNGVCNNGACICAPGYSGTGCENKVCHYSCLTCWDPYPYNCLTCESTTLTNRIVAPNYADRCDCQPGYYDSGVLNCSVCDVTCDTCNGPLATNCLTCPFIGTFFRVDNSATTGSCPCTVQYYHNAVKTCAACNYSCATCTAGPAKNQCTGCNTAAPYYRKVLASGLCDCQPGYYDNGVDEMCVPCDYTCKQCNGAGPSKCTVCDMATGINRLNQAAALNGKCPCQPGYFENSTLKQCSLCDYTCQQCTGPLNTECTLCSAVVIDHRLPVDAGQCLCDVGFYDDGSLVTCVPCHYSCFACNGPASNQCTDCNITGTNRLALNGDKQCLCAPGYYDDTTNMNCVLCHFSCTTCIAGGNLACTSCPDSVTSFRDNLSVPAGGSCPCSSGYFQVNTNVNCGKCYLTCATCSGTGANNCLTCITTGSNRITTDPTLNGGVCSCATGFYEIPSTLQCEPCDFTCQNCLGPSNTQCTQCDATMNRTDAFLSGGECRCLTDLYQIANQPQCVGCHYSCSTCTGPLFDNCLICPSSTISFRQKNSTKCPCNQGYFDNGVQICVQCHYQCLDCVNGNTNVDCTSCPSPLLYFRDDQILTNPTGEQCPCKERYYDVGAIECQKCHYSCLTCSDSLSNQCLTCSSDPTLKRATTQNALGECLCLPGFYDNGVSATCQPCHYSCSTCTGGTYDTCTSCPSALTTFRQNQSSTFKTCPCNQTGYFDDGVQICQPCHKSCQECNGSLETNCTYCPDPILTKRDNFANSLGTCPCKVGFYYNNDVVCAPCYYSCYTCSGPLVNECLTCSDVSTTFRIVDPLNPNTCICQNNYYDDGGSIICAQCYYACETCVTGNTVNECTSCLSTDNRVSQFTLGTGQCICNDKFWDLTNTKVCQVCHYSCATCSGSAAASACLTCLVNSTTNRFDSDPAAQSTCPCVEYYYDTGTMNCSPCHYSCQRCSGPTKNDCDMCQASKFRTRVTNSDGTFSCQCNQGYFDDGTLLCKPCSISCQNCVTRFDQCIECPDPVTSFRINNSLIQNTCPCSIGYYQGGSQICSACYYTCSSCNTAGQLLCTFCDKKSFRQMTPDGQCVCIDGFIDVGTLICKRCDFSCATCKGPTANDCLTCPGTYANRQNLALINNTCPCVAGYYQKGEIQCSFCHFTCDTCTGSDQLECQSCDPADNRVLDSLNHRCLCAPKFYDDFGPKCKPCHFSCSQCIGPANTQCLKCPSATDLALNNRVDKAGTCGCETGFYDTGVAFCSPCHFTCNTCTLGAAANQCDTCSSANNRADNSLTTQTCPCLPGFFEENKKTCGKCHYSCRDCAQNSAIDMCNTCDDAQFRKVEPVPGQVTVMCTCMKGYYDDGSNQICQKCDISCLQCTGPLKTDCTQCSITNNRTLQSGSCVCLAGFNDYGNVACTVCDRTCYTCSLVNNANACTECSVDSNRVQLIDPAGAYSKCVCKEFFYDDGKLQKCAVCNHSCSTCQGPSSTDCLTCPTASSYHREASGSSCPCQQGYYDDGTNHDCKPCDQACSSCSGGTSDKCSACTDGYYLTGTSCLACYYGCVLCQDSPVKCSVCQEGFMLQVDACINTGCDTSCFKCKSRYDLDCIECSPQFYRNKPPQLGCSRCNTQCAECSGSERTDCTQCFAPLVLQNSMCCDFSCETCSGPLPTQCLTCSTEMFLLNGKCLSSCTIGYYLDQFNHQCVACDENCASCLDSPFFCLTCKPNYLLNGNSCIQQNCNLPCKNCLSTSNSTCTSCQSNLYITNGGECLGCSRCCLTCSDTGMNNCKQCKSGFFLHPQSGICVPKCNINCKTCSGHNFDECTSCFKGLYHYQGTCLRQCPSGFFPNLLSFECDVCPTGCQECNQYKCFNCDSGFELNSNDDCVGTKCHESCRTCSSQNNEKGCKTCFPGFYLEKDNTCNKCIKKNCNICGPDGVCSLCASGYQFLQGECLKISCSDSCEICSMSGDCACNKCMDGYLMIGNVCTLVCPKTLFFTDDIDQTCKPCSEDCMMCEKYGTCTECLDQSRTLTQDGYCSKPNCDKSCRDCSGPTNTNCISCYPGNYLSTQFKCEVCDQNCRECKTSSSLCTSCFTDNYLSKDNKCIQVCYTGCATCTSKNQNACLTCQKGYYLFGGTCVNQCPSGYFNDDETLTCKICEYNCLECQLKSNLCTQCRPGFYLRKEDSKCVQNPIKKDMKCHWTCLLCTYGGVQGDYAACTLCVENRELKTMQTATQGECVCPKGTTDVFQERCSTSDQQDQFHTAVQSTIIASSTLSATISIIAANPIALLSVMDFAQTTSNMQYINRKNPMSFDQATSSLQWAHISTIFPVPASWDDTQDIKMQNAIKNKNSTSPSPMVIANTTNTTNSTTTSGSGKMRNLQVVVTDQSQNYTVYNNSIIIKKDESYNDQISLNQKKPYFLINAFPMIILHLVVWLLSLIVGKLTEERQHQHKLYFALRIIFYVSLPIAVFILTTSQFSLLLFYQFNFIGIDGQLTMMSFYMALIGLGYFIGIFFWLSYKCYAIFESTDEDALNRYAIITYFISKEKTSQRFFYAILMLRKIACSLIYVAGYQGPLGQIIGLFIIYFFYFCYIAIVRPFQLQKYNYLAIVTELIMLIIQFVFLLMVADEDNRSNQVNYIQCVLILMLIQLVVIAIFSLIQIILLLYAYFTKAKDHQEIVDQHVKMNESLERSSSVLKNADFDHEQPSKHNQNAASQKPRISRVQSMELNDETKARPQPEKNKNIPHKIQNSNPSSTASAGTGLVSVPPAAAVIQNEIRKNSNNESNKNSSPQQVLESTANSSKISSTPPTQLSFKDYQAQKSLKSEVSQPINQSQEKNKTLSNMGNMSLSAYKDKLNSKPNAINQQGPQGYAANRIGGGYPKNNNYQPIQSIKELDEEISRKSNQQAALNKPAFEPQDNRSSSNVPFQSPVSSNRFYHQQINSNRPLNQSPENTARSNLLNQYKPQSPESSTPVMLFDDDDGSKQISVSRNRNQVPPPPTTAPSANNSSNNYSIQNNNLFKRQ